jgi:hypothetical protein
MNVKKYAPFIAIALVIAMGVVWASNNNDTVEDLIG